MGSRVELVASPPRPIRWDELSQAATRLGWQAHADAREVRLNDAGRLVTRITLHQGEASAKTPDGRALAALIELAAQMGLRVCGEEGESYRSATETYVHRDDPDRGMAAPLPVRPGVLGQTPVWTLARLATLVLVVGVFALTVWLERRP